jgi:hypothetical protein
VRGSINEAVTLRSIRNDIRVFNVRYLVFNTSQKNRVEKNEAYAKGLLDMQHIIQDAQDNAQNF